MSYEYRVFMVREPEDSTFLHLSDEHLRDGLVIELERLGSELDRRSVIVYSVLYAARARSCSRSWRRAASRSRTSSCG